MTTVTDSIIEYLRANPTAAYALIAQQLQVTTAQVGKAAQVGRQRGLLVSRNGQGPKPLPASPHPLAPPVAVTPLPADLVGLAREAVRARLIRLADPGLIAREGSRDLRETVKLLVETHVLLAPFEAKSTSVEDEPVSLVDQLRAARKSA